MPSPSPRPCHSAALSGVILGELIHVYVYALLERRELFAPRHALRRPRCATGAPARQPGRRCPGSGTPMTTSQTATDAIMLHLYEHVKPFLVPPQDDIDL